MPREEEQEQQQLLSQLVEANARLSTTRRGDTSTKEREQALQRLENAYFAYKEIVQNLDIGRKFYNDLAPLVTKFRDDCRGFAYARRGEATQLESDIVNALPMSSLNMQSSQSQTAQSQQPTRRQPRTHTSNQQHAYVERPPPSESPLTAPTPVKPPGSISMREPDPEADTADASSVGKCRAALFFLVTLLLGFH